MRKTITVLLAGILLLGCTAKTEPAAERIRAVSEPEESAEIIEIPAVRANYGTVKKKAEETAEQVREENWEGLASLFSLSSAETFNASALKESFHSVCEGPYELIETDPVIREDVMGAIVLISCREGVLEYAFTVNDALEIESLRCALRPVIEDQVEEAEDWREVLITAGNAPVITGILTIPSENDYAPVAVLMGETLSDQRDASGTNSTLRKDLAHALAEHGIASVRFDMRPAEDPLLISVFGWDLDRVLCEDFAAIVHSLEHYPVNASKIIYAGHGTAGALGYGLVRSHFEITGGLVLINAPFEDDGVHLFARSAWMDEETADEVLDALQEDADDSAEIGGYPLSWWKQWKNMGALVYTRYVAIPILIQQGEDDQIVLFKEDYDSWKTQKGSNVTMKSYEDLGHDLRTEEDAFEEAIAEDIADWINGIDINKKETDSQNKTGTVTGKRT